MKTLIALLVLAVLGVTAGAVLASDRRAMYSSQTEIAQAETESIIAQAESQSDIAGYQSSVDLAGINALLEIARLEMETTRLANLIESEKIQAALLQSGVDLARINADLEKARAERERTWMMLIIPAALAIIAVCVVLVVLVVVLRRPAAVPNYPRITMRAPTREIVPARPQAGVIVATMVGTRKNVDHYEVRR